MEQPQEYHSFLVRLWREVGDDGLDRWYGEIEQIQNGSLRRFTSLDNLTLLLQPDASLDPWLALDSAPVTPPERQRADVLGTPVLS